MTRSTYRKKKCLFGLTVQRDKFPGGGVGTPAFSRRSYLGTGTAIQLFTSRTASAKQTVTVNRRGTLLPRLIPSSKTSSSKNTSPKPQSDTNWEPSAPMPETTGKRFSSKPLHQSFLILLQFPRLFHLLSLIAQPPLLH